MSQTERGWADPKAIEQLRRLVEKRVRAEELCRQIEDPSDQELAAEEAQLP